MRRVSIHANPFIFYSSSRMATYSCQVKERSNGIMSRTSVLQFLHFDGPGIDSKSLSLSLKNRDLFDVSFELLFNDQVRTKGEV